MLLRKEKTEKTKPCQCHCRTDDAGEGLACMENAVYRQVGLDIQDPSKYVLGRSLEKIVVGIANRALALFYFRIDTITMREKLALQQAILPTFDLEYSSYPLALLTAIECSSPHRLIRVERTIIADDDWCILLHVRRQE